MGNKYEYNANNFTHTNLTINVSVSVTCSDLELLPIFTLFVPVEKKVGADIEYYRTESIKAAKEIIIDIAKEAVM